jgi:hypothetical protein
VVVYADALPVVFLIVELEGGAICCHDDYAEGCMGELVQVTHMVPPEESDVS